VKWIVVDSATTYTNRSRPIRSFGGHAILFVMKMNCPAKTQKSLKFPPFSI